MPQYDESFFLEDSKNQRRNKRSYRVYKQGNAALLEPAKVLEALEGHGTAVLKHNIRNLKSKSVKNTGNDENKSKGNRIEDYANYCDVKNNNIYGLAAGKSLESLVSKEKLRLSDPLDVPKRAIRNGFSLHSLLEEDERCHYVSPKICVGGRVDKAEYQSGGGVRNSYSVNDVSDDVKRRGGRDRYARRGSKQQRSNIRSLEAGIYRRLNQDTSERDQDEGEFEVCAEGGEGLWSHRGSLRGANKLARRARSFKDDLLERISAMRSPAAHSPHYRSHSPLSPKTRGNVACKSASHDDVEVNPAKDLEQLVRQVRFDLKHFCDVISKRKLEMLSGNGTIVLDTITNIHTAIRPYLASPCPALQTALTTVCTALAGLIRLCDEALMAEDASTCDALQAANVSTVVGAVQAAVEELATLALERMGGRPALAPRSAVVTPRAHASPATPHAQRNSLPDIPLTPKERALLSCGGTGAAGAAGVRATHSTESILDSVATEQPPPKPPRPERKIDIAPPLPPKKKMHDGSLLGLSAIDRVSLQSHSSGSLDSMLNASNDDEIRAIMEQSTANLDDSNLHHPTSDILAICSCVSSDGYSNRVSLDSSSTTHTNHSGVSVAEQTAANTAVTSMHNHDGHNTLVASSATTQHTANHNRFSNESGFVSMGHAARCSEISYASSSFNCSRTLGFTEINCAMDSVLGVTETTTSSSSLRQSNASNTVVRGNGLLEINKEGYQLDMKSATHMFKQNSITHVHNSNGNSIDVKHHSDMSSMSLNATDAGLPVPPALPAKTRRSTRSRPESSDTASGEFPGVEIRQHWNSCAVHGEMAQRPHTLADNAPPPLPLKKKHMFQSVAYSVMAYMEMFGNCSHPPNAAVAATEMFRHSIHTYNLAGNHQQSQALHQQHLQTQHVQQLEQKSIAQSVTLHHFNAQQTNCSMENNSLSCVSPNTPIVSLPPTPPALPPKKNKLKQSPSRSPAPPSPRLGAPELQVSDATTPPHEPAYHLNNSCEEESSACKVGKFPVCELDTLCTSSASGSPSPGGFTHSADDSAAAHDSFSESGGRGEEQDIITELDVSGWLVLKAPDEEGPDVRGGHPDALIVHATKASKDFAYQEAFLTTYRTFVVPSALVSRLARRAAALAARQRRARARETHALLARVVSDLTTQDLDGALLQEIMEFVYSLVQSGDLAMAKALRVIILDKYKQLQTMSDTSWPANLTASAGLSSRRETLLDFKASELAEQMTLLDAALFTRIAPAEVLAWTRHQAEDTSPNLTQFTEHFNKMSYWARSRILEQEEARDREKYMLKFIKVMKHLRKINNFNSYLALLSALDSGPIRRLEWPRSATEALDEYCALIDSSSSFRAYRQALAETQPPCIPYIGLVLQDLTFIHIGNSDQLPDGSINFSKRWQQYHIVENMKRFNKAQYTFRKSERVMAMFNGFDEVLSEEAMWQISQQIKPRGGRTKPQAAAGQTAA